MKFLNDLSIINTFLSDFIASLSHYMPQSTSLRTDFSQFAFSPQIGMFKAMKHLYILVH